MLACMDTPMEPGPHVLAPHGPSLIPFCCTRIPVARGPRIVILCGALGFHDDRPGGRWAVAVRPARGRGDRATPTGRGVAGVGSGGAGGCPDSCELCTIHTMPLCARDYTRRLQQYVSHAPWYRVYNLKSCIRASVL